MDPTQLRDTLSQHDADPDIVLTKLHTKLSARRRRQQVTGVLAAVLVVTVGIGTWSTIGRAPASSPSPAVGALPGAETTGGAADSGFGASGCLALTESISRTAADGVSLITAQGKLTGRTGIDGYDHQEMVLTHVRTLVGPKVSDGATAWTLTVKRPATPEPGVTEGGPDGPLWGPEGALIGFYATQQVNKGPLGATINHVPVVGENAILLADDCWNGFAPGDLKGTPYSGPLTEIPGSNTYDRLARRGFVAIPLKSIEGLIK
ncbi:hypothetical protein DMB66_58250 [Actinoplanes sp. ATCC 53533]|uniref:hypothetical protein n=1 Tax=Actinoplanes sp. ATCC 53533 TaxID=1288362 RepID=UPI000F7967CE|nr:hypothetical protein [Actinoplanes sp. ATCC 53533]RSM39405.1 hypothetical protein DMB66_58250 [Actinoplanes sp. ATCC 53533]